MHEIKVGDKVLLRELVGDYYDRRWFFVIREITRTTKTQCMIEDAYGERKFSKQSLNEIGDSWKSSYLELDLSKDQTAKYNEYCEKLRLLCKLPDIYSLEKPDIDKISINELENLVNLYVQLLKGYTSKKQVISDI